MTVRPARIGATLLAAWFAVLPVCATDELPHPADLDLSVWTGDMPDYYGVVVDVYDGDTFYVDWYTEDRMAVRPKGIDTPEIGGRAGVEYLGPEAAEYAHARLRPGTPVRLDFAGEITDPFGRLLAYVWYWDGVQWVFWNRELLEQGMAIFYEDYPFERPLEFLAAQAQAIGAGRGMWADPARVEAVARTPDELARRQAWFRAWLEERE